MSPSPASPHVRVCIFGRPGAPGHTSHQGRFLYTGCVLGSFILPIFWYPREHQAPRTGEGSYIPRLYVEVPTLVFNDLVKQ